MLLNRKLEYRCEWIFSIDSVLIIGFLGILFS